MCLPQAVKKGDESPHWSTNVDPNLIAETQKLLHIYFYGATILVDGEQLVFMLEGTSGWALGLVFCQECNTQRQMMKTFVRTILNSVR